MVELVKHAATLCKVPLQGPGGEELFGGHSFRTTGACWMASLGLELMLVQLHGRWKSSIVEHYFSTSPLARITEKIRKQIRDAAKELEAEKTDPSTTERTNQELHTVLNDLRTRLAEIGKAHDELMARCLELEEGNRKHMYVYAARQKRWHETNTPELYSTEGCKWAYRGSDVRLQEEIPALLPADTLCYKCFPTLSFS